MSKVNKSVYLHLRVSPAIHKAAKKYGLNVSETCRDALVDKIEEAIKKERDHERQITRLRR